VLLASGPHWLGSPQHFFGGIGLALVTVVLARWFGISTVIACILAIGFTSAVEIVVELVEYPLMYSGHFHATAYYDTLADMGNSLVGAILGSAIGPPSRGAPDSRGAVNCGALVGSRGLRPCSREASGAARR
jgi:hypothetical protein